MRTFREAMDYLSRTTNYEQRGPSRYTPTVFKLDRMRSFAHALGDPQEKLRAIHIAGTKGKGSVAYMAEAVLREAGFRTGLYLSPHVTGLTERIQAGGRKILRKDFARLVGLVRPAAERMAAANPELRPTFFEIMTAIAFLHFVERGADIAVLEVGLGGRLDATNIVNPLAGAITFIGMDHMRELGATIGRIAREKAGILKPGRSFVVAPQTREAERAIEAVARKVGARLIRCGKEYRSLIRPDGKVDVFTPLRKHEGLSPAMAGIHQLENAAVATALVDELAPFGFSVNEEALRRGLASARAPARFEILRKRPLVIIDGAHNQPSAKALARELGRQGLSDGKLRLVAGLARDKDADAFFAEFSHLKPFRVVLTRAQSPRAAPVRALAAAAERHFKRAVRGPGDVAATVARELARMRPSDALCVTGSFYVASEARAFLLGGKSSKSSIRA